jgi:hypothetical protein
VCLTTHNEPSLEKLIANLRKEVIPFMIHNRELSLAAEEHRSKHRAILFTRSASNVISIAAVISE